MAEQVEREPLRHPDDNLADEATFEEIIATGGFSDIARWEHFSDRAALKAGEQGK